MLAYCAASHFIPPRAFRAGHDLQWRYQNYLGNLFIGEGDIIPILNTVLKSAALLMNLSVLVYNYKEYSQFGRKAACLNTRHT